MSDVDQAGPFITRQCVRCGWEAVGGICDECLAELEEWLHAAARTWRKYPPRQRRAALRSLADHAAALADPLPDGVTLALAGEAGEVTL